MKGFTIIELVISVAIFAFMTALVISKYGTFNQNTLLVNVAYDMALTVRTAQSYGLSVKSVDGSNTFNVPYGVHFDMSSRTKFVFFVDNNKNYKYDPSNGISADEAITTYTLNSSATILSICLGSDPINCTSLGPNDSLDVTYKRPNPDAQFNCFSSSNPAPTVCSVINLVGTNNSNPISQPVAFITIQSSDKTNSQIVAIRKNGQISVGNQ